MRDELDAQIAALGLTDHFHFAGLVPPAQVHRYLAQADLLWHLSLREGLPRSVVQALATGIPAIGYRLDGTPEVIRDGETGLLRRAAAGRRSHRSDPEDLERSRSRPPDGGDRAETRHRTIRLAAHGRYSGKGIP